MKNKLIALLMALVMVASMMSVAAAETSATQIVNAGATVYYDDAGNKTDDVLGQGNSVVEMTKTVAGTANENEFEVTLQVKTTQDVRIISSDTPDAAVMLVLDLSNSMNECVNCGEDENHRNHEGNTTSYWYCDANHDTVFETNRQMRGRCVHCNRYQNQHEYVTATSGAQCAYMSRLDEAKIAAKDFVAQFANETGADEKDKRMVAIVTFNSNAYTKQNWIDVNSGDNLDAVQDIIDDLATDANTQNGGTNIEAGLMLADNILRADLGTNGAIEGYSNIYTIMLTDGIPTFYVRNSSNSTSEIAGTRGGFDKTDVTDVEDVGDEASSIRSQGSILYSVCFGTINGTDVWDTKPFGNWSSANPATTQNMTVGQWLSAFSNSAYNGGESAKGLFESFDSIMMEIKKLAEAWQVTDTMGEDILYGNSVVISNGQGGSLNNTITVAEDENSFVWNIRTSDYDPSITTMETDEDGNTSGVLGYTYKYTVTLDNLSSTYSPKTAEQATNTSALLDYAVNTDDTWYFFEDAAFAVPSVKGLVADLSFTKVDENGEPISGVNFTLKDEDNRWNATATSSADGSVSFSGIPSGHDYLLTENLPEGSEFVTPDNMDVNVAWGVASMAVLNDGKLVNEWKKTPTVSLTLKKEFTGNIKPDAVTIQVSGPDHKMVTLNEENGWTDTLTGLASGTYTLTEVASIEGYNQTVTITGSNAEQNGNSATVELLPVSGGEKNYQVTFKNDYTQQTGTITVNKAFVGQTYTGDITVNVKQGNKVVAALFLNSGNSWTATTGALPVGEYTLEEVEENAQIAGYALIPSFEGGATVNIQTDKENVTKKLTNTYTQKLGAVQFNKVLLGDEQAFPESITFTISGNGITRSAVANAENNWTVVIDQLPVGTYTVQETAQGGGYLVSAEWSSSNVSVEDKKTTSVTCTNTYEDQLSIAVPVEKTVQMTGNQVPGITTFHFDVNVEAAEGCELAISYQNDDANTAGKLVAADGGFDIVVEGVGTVKGSIVVKGYRDDLAGMLSVKEVPNHTSQIAASVDGWEYDATAFGEMVWVAEITAENGVPQAHIYRTDNDTITDTMSFTNTYTKNIVVEVPETGDHSHAALWLLLLVVSAANLMLILRRKHV